MDNKQEFVDGCIQRTSCFREEVRGATHVREIQILSKNCTLLDEPHAAAPTSLVCKWLNFPEMEHRHFVYKVLVLCPSNLHQGMSCTYMYVRKFAHIVDEKKMNCMLKSCNLILATFSFTQCLPISENLLCHSLGQLLCQLCITHLLHTYSRF